MIIAKAAIIQSIASNMASGMKNIAAPKHTDTMPSVSGSPIAVSLRARIAVTMRMTPVTTSQAAIR